jgi:hypothetical protein
VESSALLQELVDEGGLTVVNVGDNGDVSDFRLIHGLPVMVVIFARKFSKMSLIWQVQTNFYYIYRHGKRI